LVGGCGTKSSPRGNPTGIAGQPGTDGAAGGGGSAPSTSGEAGAAPLEDASAGEPGAAAGAGGGGGGGAAGASNAAGASGSGAAGAGGGGGADAAVTTPGCNGRPLCWDFDDGKVPQGFTKWRDTPASTGVLLVDDTRPFGGHGYSLHAKDLQGGPQHTLKYVLPPSFGPVMWGRLRMYTTPTRPDAHAGFFNARYPKPGQPDTAPENQLNWYEVASYTQAYMSIFHPPWPPGFPEDVQVSDTQLVLDRWTCVEWFFDGKNDADPTQAALPRMWLDGQDLAWPMHFTYSEPAGAKPPFRDKVRNFTVIELGIVTWQAVPTPTSWWIDDVAIGTQRIGCD
jgi:hypothetical protein